jgi:hypothetical protein
MERQRSASTSTAGKAARPGDATADNVGEHTVHTSNIRHANDLREATTLSLGQVNKRVFLTASRWLQQSTCASS